MPSAVQVCKIRRGARVTRGKVIAVKLRSTCARGGEKLCGMRAQRLVSYMLVRAAAESFFGKFRGLWSAGVFCSSRIYWWLLAYVFSTRGAVLACSRAKFFSWVIIIVSFVRDMFKNLQGKVSYSYAWVNALLSTMSECFNFRHCYIRDDKYRCSSCN